MSRRNPYAEHVAFARLALPYTQGWRIFAVIVAFEAVFSLSPVVLDLWMVDAGPTWPDKETWNAFATTTSFAIFGASALALFGLVRLFNHRGPSSLVGPLSRAWRDLRAVLLATGLVVMVEEVAVHVILPADLVAIRPIGTWLLWLLPGLTALFIQVSTEELFFRGYLQQPLAAVTTNRWVWIGLPSVVFGLGHGSHGGDATEVTLWIVWATGLGLVCADLTARTGTIGAAIGLHLANNIFAVLVVGVEGWPESGLALLLYDDPTGTTAPPFERALQFAVSLMGLLVMWLAARIALRR